jgi:hypothetical protein
MDYIQIDAMSWASFCPPELCESGLADCGVFLLTTHLVALLIDSRASVKSGKSAVVRNSSRDFENFGYFRRKDLNCQRQHSLGLRESSNTEGSFNIEEAQFNQAHYALSIRSCQVKIP